MPSSEETALDVSPPQAMSMKTDTVSDKYWIIFGMEGAIFIERAPVVTLVEKLWSKKIEQEVLTHKGLT